MIIGVGRLLPLDMAHQNRLLEEFGSISRAVAAATLLSAIVQGLLAGIGYYFAGLPSVFLLTMLTIFAGMIPFVGAAAVWLPAVLWLGFFETRWMAAILLAIWGGAVVSMVDNLVKPLVLHGQSNLHPLLALLSVLGGVQALGPIGIFVGPMAVVFLQAGLKMLNTEIGKFERVSLKQEAALK
jgi:predicted PurR-regulated permease PerM